MDCTDVFKVQCCIVGFVGNQTALIFIKSCKGTLGHTFIRGADQKENDVMAKDTEQASADLSRRSILLRGAACAAGVATIIVTDINAAQAAKLPQVSAGYQPKPNGDRQCSNCKLFEPPNACKSVAGVISPNGYCSLYRKA